MFGDVAAWIVNYLAGIQPDPAGPGFRRFRIEPCLVDELGHVEAAHKTPTGRVAMNWSRGGSGAIDLRMGIPEGSTATLALPGEDERELGAGEQRIEIPATIANR